VDSGDHATPEGFQMAHPRFIRKPVLENGWWWELCTIIQGGSWHYDLAKGEKINKTDAVLRALAEVRCLGGNLLANIGPRPDGTFQDEVWRLFDEMAEWMSTNEASCLRHRRRRTLARAMQRPHHRQRPHLVFSRQARSRHHRESRPP
jgi:alpha-L-fucosidase